RRSEFRSEFTHEPDPQLLSTVSPAANVAPRPPGKTLLGSYFGGTHADATLAEDIRDRDISHGSAAPCLPACLWTGRLRGLNGGYRRRHIRRRHPRCESHAGRRAHE